jgi:hypothetical protein
MSLKFMVHMAHGFLVHGFMSPVSNKRTDQYSGSFENGIRLLVEVVEVLSLIPPLYLYGECQCAFSKKPQFMY